MLNPFHNVFDHGIYRCLAKLCQLANRSSADASWSSRVGVEKFLLDCSGYKMTEININASGGGGGGGGGGRNRHNGNITDFFLNTNFFSFFSNPRFTIIAYYRMFLSFFPFYLDLLVLKIETRA